MNHLSYWEIPYIWVEIQTGDKLGRREKPDGHVLWKRQCPRPQGTRGSTNSLMSLKMRRIICLHSQQISTQITKYRCGTNPLWKRKLCISCLLQFCYSREKKRFGSTECQSRKNPLPSWCVIDKEWIHKGTSKIAEATMFERFKNCNPIPVNCCLCGSRLDSSSS